jgi:hypothetical protein
MSRNIPPSVVYPSPNEWPVTYRAITGITRSKNAIITSIAHGFTSADIPSTALDFTQVKGMFQINGKVAYIKSIVDADNFIIDLDTSQFYDYTSGGYANIMAGISPYDPYSNIA